MTRENFTVNMGISPGAVEAPSDELVDLVRPPSLRRASGLPFPLVVPAVAVTAERERGLHLELALDPSAPLLPPLLVLDLVPMEPPGVLVAWRVTELDPSAGGLG